MSLNHHAYLVLRTDENTRDVAVRHIGSELDMDTEGNPDVIVEYFENLGIDEARHIAAMQSRRPVTGKKKVIFLECDALTMEAQNALLKTFEEPTDSTLLFLCVPTESSIIPTLRSRLVVLDDFEQGDATSAQTDATDFVDATPGVRLVHIADMIEEGNKATAADFVSRVGAVYQARGGVSSYRDELQAVVHAEKLLAESGSSIKIILEHLAVTL